MIPFAVVIPEGKACSPHTRTEGYDTQERMRQATRPGGREHGKASLWNVVISVRLTASLNELLHQIKQIGPALAIRILQLAEMLFTPGNRRKYLQRCMFRGCEYPANEFEQLIHDIIWLLHHIPSMKRKRLRLRVG